MNRLSTFDIVKICGYVASIGGVLTVQVVNSLLHPWGVNEAAVTAISGEIGSVVLLATLLSNVVKNPSPKTGTFAVVSTDANPTPDTLTTHAAPAPPAAPDTKGPTP